jgi:hypothetical protein
MAANNVAQSRVCLGATARRSAAAAQGTSFAIAIQMRPNSLLALDDQ